MLFLGLFSLCVDKDEIQHRHTHTHIYVVLFVLSVNESGKRLYGPLDIATPLRG